MENVRTGVCGLCGGECLVDAHIKDGHIESIEGNADLPGSSGKLCVKGAALKQYIHNPERILYPMRRTGARGSGEFERISWDEALDTIADRMRETRDEHSADETFLYVGHPKWFRPQLVDFANRYGTANYGTESSTCAYAMVMAFQSCYGIPSFPIPDVRNTDTLVLWGTNPSYSRSTGFGPLMNLRKAGKRLIAVDPRCTPTTELADLHLRPLPGTDGALALGIGHVIIREDLYDKAFVEKNTVGFDRYRKYVEEFTPERVEKITSVPADEIIKAARWMAEGRCGLQMSASPVVHNINGFQNARAGVLLMALTGNVRRPGGILAPGNRPRGLNASFGVGRSAITNIERCLSYEKFPVWSNLIGEVQVCDLPRYLNGEGKTPVRNLITFGMNTHMWPRHDLLMKEFDKAEFIVSADAFMTEACLHADIVLPCQLDLEREQVRIIGGNHLFYQPGILTHGDLKSDLEILMGLAERLGFTIGEPPIRNTEEYLSMQMEGLGVTLDELKKAGGLMKIPDEAVVGQGARQGDGKPENAAGGKSAAAVAVDGNSKAAVAAAGGNPEGSEDQPMFFPTPSGKIEFCSGLLPEDEALPIYRDFREGLPLDAFPLILVTGSRKPQLFHSRTYRMPWLANLEPVPAVDIHPEDAAALSIADGETVKLESPVGEKRLRIHLDPSVHRGTVCVYHGAGDLEINDLIDLDYRDPYTGFPGFKSYCCRITKCGEEA